MGKFAVSSGNAGKIAGMTALALTHKTKSVDLNRHADPHQFNVQNGTLHFFAVADDECPDPDVTRLKWCVRLEPHEREVSISKMAPVDYDPAARCPQWLQLFLDRCSRCRKCRRSCAIITAMR